ncbi:unnamed protein product [Linum tenue]|uniref:Regulatory particle non-ATPase 13 n=1 Tax=Linum tenue TaxID=586396 RepID=A0AAV0S6C5_9ROSI|nr:unnamed protein product [Linum tenue]
MLEFRAGKMHLEGKKVVPDTRKGLVRIDRGEEGLIHFQWLDRTLNAVEDDQIIFPDEAVFEKVGQASGRVYILKFNTDDRKFFFWMQPEILEEEPDTTALQMSEDMVEDEISSRAGNLVLPNLGSGSMSDVTSSSGPVRLEDLQRILSNSFGLGDIFRPDLIMPLMDTLPVEERLVSYLPEGPWTPEDILELLQSAPFRQQIDSFTYVLKTGQIDLSQFGVDPSKFWYFLSLQSRKHFNSCLDLFAWKSDGPRFCVT